MSIVYLNQTCLNNCQLWGIRPPPTLVDYHGTHLKSAHKKGGVGKIGGVLLKKSGTLSLIFILTNPFQPHLSLSEWWCVFCLFTPYLLIFFVFHGKNLSCIESNQQIYDFYKSVIFEKRRDRGTLYSNFLMSANYSFNLIQRAAVST